MKRKIKDMIDSYITTLAGLATMILTLFLIYKGTFDFVWERNWWISSRYYSLNSSKNY